MAAVEVILYVLDDSEMCRVAEGNFARLAGRHDPAAFTFTVRDLSRDPLRPDEPSIIVVPAVFIRHAAEHDVLATDLTGEDAALVESILADLGIRSANQGSLAQGATSPRGAR